MHWNCEMWAGGVTAIAATAARLTRLEHRHTAVLPEQHLPKHLFACPAQLDPAQPVVLSYPDAAISDGNNDAPKRV